MWENYAYQKNGPTGLVPKLRNDAAHCRVIPAELLNKAVALKLEAPDRSVRQIIRILELTGSCPEGFLKPSTLSNHLFEAKPVQKLVEGNIAAYRRYEMAYRNQVWQADTQHTLYLPHPTLPNKRRLAYLIVFLDDYSRLITHGEFFFEENVLSLEQVFKKAILKHGIPEKLYVDNGAIYASQHLQSICTRLKTHLIHAKPYRPQGKGKYEVDLRLVGKKVALRFDPQDLSRLEVWFDDEQYPDALPLNMTRHRHKALPELEEEPRESTGLNFLEATKTALAKEQAESLRNSLSFAKLIKEDNAHD